MSLANWLFRERLMMPNEYFKLPEGEKEIIRGFVYAECAERALDRRLSEMG